MKEPEPNTPISKTREDDANAIECVGSLTTVKMLNSDWPTKVPRVQFITGFLVQRFPVRIESGIKSFYPIKINEIKL